MDALMLLVLLSLCALAHGEPVRAHHGEYGSYVSEYARESARDYEPPVVYAAIPLHKPLPLLQVLSRRPLARAPSVQHAVYARPPVPDHEYAPSAHNDYEYPGPGEPQGYAEPLHNYAEPYLYASTVPQYGGPAGFASQDEVTILYARPNPHGGFSYRRRPTKYGPKRVPAPTTESPVLIRVHKYRVIRDR